MDNVGSSPECKQLVSAFYKHTRQIEKENIGPLLYSAT